MKRIILLAVVMGFALVGSAVRADAMTMMMGTGEKVIYNGVTDFSGHSYDSLSISPIETTSGWMEQEAAGGYREEMGGALYNAVTDFSGRTYDSLEIGPVSGTGGYMESMGTGGFREEEMTHPYNGVTDFSGRSYDYL